MSISAGYTETGDIGGNILQKRADDFYMQNEPFVSPQWSEAQIDIRFTAGDQQLMNILYDPKSQVNNPFVINLMQRYIGMLTGFQGSHRKSIVMMPVHEDSDQICDDYNGCFKWSEEKSNFQDIFSDSVEQHFITGESLMHAYPNYSIDLTSPDLEWKALGSLWFMMDSQARKRDLSDCEGIYTRQWISKRKAKKLLPGRAKEIDALPWGWGQDGKFPIQQALLANKIESLVPYDEFHYLSTRSATVIFDPQSKEFVEYEKEKDMADDELKRVMQAMPWLVVKKMEVPTVKLGILIAGKPFYDGKNHLNIDRYPFAWNACNLYPDTPAPRMRKQGFSRVMRSLQFLYTLRKMAELSILQSQANTGWIYAVDAVTDPKAFRQTSDGIVIPLKKGHKPEEIRRIEPPVINPSIIELSKILKDDFGAVTGITDELLGANMKDTSGILEMFRQAAGLVTLHKYFDHVDFCLRQCGEIQRDFFRKNWTRSKVRNILGREPDKRFFSNLANRYSIAVEEGTYSATQRQMELQQYLHFKQIGMNVADKTIWRAAFLTNKRKAMQEAEEVSRQQQQAQMAQQQAEQQDHEATNMQKVAKAQLDQAKATQTIAQLGI